MLSKMKASKAKLWGFIATSEDCGTLTANALLHKSADVKKLSIVFIFTPFSPSLLESVQEQMVMAPLHGHWVGGMGSELVSSSTSASPPRELQWKLCFLCIVRYQSDVKSRKKEWTVCWVQWERNSRAPLQWSRYFCVLFRKNSSKSSVLDSAR